MKRLHMSINVTDLDKSIQFYSHLFGEKPSFVRDDYAKWMLEDPRVNFVLEKSSEASGLTHAGIQTDNDEELAEVFARMKSAEIPYLEEGTTTCCYAKSDKSWTFDPDGLPWEAFFTHHQMEERGQSTLQVPVNAACCAGC